jgi:hypothetical protein
VKAFISYALFVLEEQRYQGRIVPLLYRPCEHKKLS